MVYNRGGRVCIPLTESLWIEFLDQWGFSIQPEYIFIILTGSTIAAIGISIYSPLNIF